MNEKEMMEDLLATEKQVISAYSTGITETSCKNLRNTLVNNFRNVQDIQFRVFDSLKQKGWYSTKDAPDTDVMQVKNESNQLMRELV
jgi:spore coat protein F